MLKISLTLLSAKRLASALKLLFLFTFSVAALAETNAEPSPNHSMGEFCNKLPRADYADLEKVDDPDSWFQVYQVAVGVKAIYEAHQWQETISYLIEGKSKALLFDTGNGIGDIHGLVKRLSDKPITVLNSHSHSDHVGGNHAFKRVYGMTTRFTSERQKGILNKDIGEEVSAAALCRPLPKGVSEETHVGRPYKISKRIEDGYIFELGGRRIEVIHVPGHTPDATALIDREQGLLWTGDTFYAGPIWLYAPETDLLAYAKSLDRLVLELPNVTTLLPAHNTPLVSAEILPSVRRAFTQVINGSAKRQESFQGTVIYSIEGESRFSFLLRDNPFSYRRDQ
ncbi:MAG: glyoxylase-like metal-dependent hydrolase (beta-lactamase superfamily II) [Arenicella sp.]|jgi:glyoxylase-like metal-dependent hydrolase (beta-lactamase superfamily II)